MNLPEDAYPDSTQGFDDYDIKVSDDQNFKQSGSSLKARKVLDSSLQEESKDTTEAAPAEKIEIDEVNSANLQINYKFSFNFFA